MNEVEHMGDVDQAPGVDQPTEADEERVLRELFGSPDADGVYRGEGA
ncbi:hypothetical protein [Spirillospora sp. NBC_01491]|nr:hypothetical protein [Spirillospora sp. NBC_01491]